MNLADIWNIVWQDTPFHIAIAIVLFFAIAYETYTLIEYFYLKCGATANGIKYLNKLPHNKKNKPSKQVYSWLTKHLETDNNHGYLKIESKFILKKYPIVLSRPVPRSSLRFVTTLCTSIGVLGTFYGIQQGLQDINLGDISNSQQLMTSSIGLLVNMKTAFSTSLMGLGCGSLFTLILFATDSLRRQRHDDLRDKFDEIATFKTAENDNQSLENPQPPTAKEIGEAVGRSIAEQFTGLNQLTSEAIGKAVAKQMYLQLKPIYEEQQKLRKQFEENQGHKVIEKLIQDLIVQVIEPVTQRLDESARLTQQASEAVTNLHNELGGISQSLASSI